MLNFPKPLSNHLQDQLRQAFSAPLWRGFRSPSFPKLAETHFYGRRPNLGAIALMSFYFLTIHDQHDTCEVSAPRFHIFRMCGCPTEQDQVSPSVKQSLLWDKGFGHIHNCCRIQCIFLDGDWPNAEHGQSQRLGYIETLQAAVWSTLSSETAHAMGLSNDKIECRSRLGAKDEP